jgi:transcriptional regulator with XRE-family HTH domain
VNELAKGLRESLKDEDSRYAYADMVTNTLVSAQIKALREERNLTQEKLAELMGTKQSGISRLQKADYSAWKVETLRKFARAFGVRLCIGFEEFGTLFSDVGGFTKKRLEPRKFEDDPAFSKADDLPETAVACAGLNLAQVAAGRLLGGTDAWTSALMNMRHITLAEFATMGGGNVAATDKRQRHMQRHTHRKHNVISIRKGKAKWHVRGKRTTAPTAATA